RGAQRQRGGGGGLADPAGAGADDDLHPGVGQDPVHVQREVASHIPEGSRHASGGAAAAGSGSRHPSRGSATPAAGATLGRDAGTPSSLKPVRQRGTPEPGARQPATGPVRQTSAPPPGSPALQGPGRRAATGVRRWAAQGRPTPRAGSPPTPPGAGTR